MDFETPIGPSRPERALQAYGLDEGQSEAVVHPHSRSQTYFELVECFEGMDEMYVRYAQGINESYIGHATKIRVRAEGGDSVTRKWFAARTRRVGGAPMPFAVRMLD
jgi:hypothetical protein